MNAGLAGTLVPGAETNWSPRLTTTFCTCSVKVQSVPVSSR